MSEKGENETVPYLSNLIIFNPTLCTKEGLEGEKILFYYAADPTVTEDAMIRQVGLCEGMINFAARFSSKPCQALHTRRTRQVFYGPEPDFHMILTVAFTPETHVSNLTLMSILKMSYNIFTLFYGSFTRMMNAYNNIQLFKEKLARFFTPYISTLNMSNSDLLDHYSGVKFLPIDTNSYLCCQRFINSLQHRHPQVLYTTILFKDSLIHSGVNKEDTKVLYHYLVNILFPTHLDFSDLEVISKTLQTVGRYLNGPKNFDEDDSIKASRLYLHTDSSNGQLTEVFLLVYHSLNVTVCLMIDATSPCTKKFYKSVDSFLMTNVNVFDTLLSRQVRPSLNSSSAPLDSSCVRYLFYNYDNLAFRSTLHNLGKLVVPPDFMKLICDIAQSFEKEGGDIDIMLKTLNDYWIIVKKCRSRVLFCVITQKNINIIGITDEVRKLTQTMFSKALFIDV